MPRFGEEGHPPSLGAKTQFGTGNQRTDLGGRPKSIRNQLRELMAQDGAIRIPKQQIIRIDEETGDVVLKLPTDKQLAMKLVGMAMNGNNANTARALAMVMEQVDGKAPQKVIHETQTAPLTKEQIEEELKKVDAIIDGLED